MSVRAATLKRIEDAHRFGGFYRGYLANHLPMALVALDHMGADDATLERFERAHLETHLEPIGNDREFQRAVEGFETRIARAGTVGRTGAGRRSLVWRAAPGREPAADCARRQRKPCRTLLQP